MNKLLLPTACSITGTDAEFYYPYLDILAMDNTADGYSPVTYTPTVIYQSA